MRHTSLKLCRSKCAYDSTTSWHRSPIQHWLYLRGQGGSGELWNTVLLLRKEWEDAYFSHRTPNKPLLEMSTVSTAGMSPRHRSRAATPSVISLWVLCSCIMLRPEHDLYMVIHCTGETEAMTPPLPAAVEVQVL